MVTHGVGFGFGAGRLYPRSLKGREVTPRRALFPAPPFDGLMTGGSEDDIPESLPRVEVRQSPGRGLGVFAVDAVPAYSCILEDYASLSLSGGEDLPQLWLKYLVLPPEDREAFDALGTPEHQLKKESAIIAKLLERGYGESEAGQMARVSSRFIGNSFKTDEEGSKWLHALFATVARVNHSCTPNALSHYRFSTGAEYVFALRDIQPGEEVEISYFDTTKPLAERSARMATWSFQCRCPACEGTIKADYERLLAAVQEWSHLDRGLQYRHGARTPGLPQRIQTAISVAEFDRFPWLRASLAGLYGNLTGALMNHRRPVREVADSLEQAALWKERTCGRDHPEAIMMRVRVKTMRDDDKANSEKRSKRLEELARSLGADNVYFVS